MNVIFTYNSGRERRMTRAEAEVLQLLGHGRYEAQAVSAPSPAPAPSAATAPVAQEPALAPDGTAPAAPPSVPMDELDGLDAAALHALAKERGVKVHHNAGADKVRAALRDAALAN
ncbi:hypothetical protein [Comamonas sp. B21-038]|uniref:hypothetical protein n=1 Tax=Comamonas sp. B21-038 TaxID=2918299 RepID=UPI001EFA7A1D|nr:hypothetical protein [Comamonas sp. B21-038]ULR87186.1 hypothetical protein MJ205_11915 [Comamonas sp. B21-038]